MKKLYNQFLCSQLILPEHRQELKNHDKQRKEKEIVIPDLDDQEMARWEQLAQNSLKTGHQISILLLHNNRNFKIVGAVISYNSNLNNLRVKTTDTIETVPIKKIVAVEEAEI